MQLPSSLHRNIPNRHSCNDNDENNGKAEELRPRRQRRRRRRPISNNTNVLSQSTPSSNSQNDSKNHQESSSPCLPSRMDDPFYVIAVAVDHDENKRNSLEILQVPLETGKLYHNEKIFLRALSHLRKESQSFRLARWMPFSSSSSWNEGLNDDNLDETNGKLQESEKPTKPAVQHQKSLARAAITPIILSGLLATVDDSNFQTRKQCASSATANNRDSIQTAIITMKTSSTDLVNYTVGMRRAAITRVRLRIKRERTQRIVKPVLAIATVLCLYCYAWSSLQRLLVGFYGVTRIVLAPPENSHSNPFEVRVNLLRLMTSSCRSRANAEHYGYLSDYAKACRITEATTFELLTTTHNSLHTKLFARTAYDEIDSEPGDNSDALVDNYESRTKLSAALMQYDDDYSDDTELPLYAMHTTLSDNESSIIPLEDVIHGWRRDREKLQRQRWRRRRRRQRKYKQQQQNDELESENSGNIAATYARLSRAVQFWGDTTVNYLVREAIVEAHYKPHPPPLSSKTTKAGSGSNIKNKMKLLDVGSGLSGTLFSLCTPEFPFEDWSYHGIAISQPEVRRAKELVDTVVRPIISSASTVISSSTKDSGNRIVDGPESGSSNSNSFPLTNITIQRASFDDPLPVKEYTTMVAIESLAFSQNITKTLINLAKSLKPKGTLIVVEDVVPPWAVVTADAADNSSDNYVQKMADLSGKPSLLTHENWLESFSKADLILSRPPRDLMLEFDALSLDNPHSATAGVVTGLPFIGLLMGERSWYSTGHGVLKTIIDLFGGRYEHDGVEDDDGNLYNRALYLIEDLTENDRGNAYRRAGHRRADLGYYMYVCRKR